MEEIVTIVDDSRIMLFLVTAALIASLFWFYHLGKTIVNVYRTEKAVYYRWLKFDGKSAGYAFFAVMGTLLFIVVGMIILVCILTSHCMTLYS